VPPPVRDDGGTPCFSQIGESRKPRRAIEIDDNKAPARPQDVVDLAKASTPGVRGQVMQNGLAESVANRL
jgi:hypothetical protein